MKKRRLVGLLRIFLSILMVVGLGLAYGSTKVLATPIEETTLSTTVEINNGNAITLDLGESINATTSSGIPVTVKNLPALGAPTNGLAGFRFDFSWNKDAINLTTPKTAMAAGWDMILPGTPNNTTGNLTSTGFTTTYATDDVILIYLGITAVGVTENFTSINVTITWLGDKDGVSIPATSVNAKIEIQELISIAVSPIAPYITSGQTQQFTAIGNYTSGFQNITNKATWTSSNTNIAMIDTNGLATSVNPGTTTITATYRNVSNNTILTVTSSVEINSGKTITLSPSEGIVGSTTGGIPIEVRELPNLGAPTNGPAAFTFDFSWNKNAIRVDSININTVATEAGWNITLGIPNNTTGTLTSSGFTTVYSTSDIILLYLGITALEYSGSNTTISVTITYLGDKNGITIPALPINATIDILVSIDVDPTNPSIILGQTQQFTATGIYTSNKIANLTPIVIWTSSNTSTATVNSDGLATAIDSGITIITASSGSLKGSANLYVIPTVEVNNGNTLVLKVGQIIKASGTNGIPVMVKNLPNFGLGSGLAAFRFDFSWNPDIIRVDSVCAATAATSTGWNITLGTANNTSGTLTSTGFSTIYSTDDVILLYLEATAVGAVGDSTYITMTTTNLGDKDGVSIPTTSVNAKIEIIDYIVETSISQGLSSNIPSIAVVKINIDCTKDLSNNSTAIIPGGIGSYSATVSGSPSNAIQFLGVNGISPFTNPNFNTGTGVFSVANVTSPIQPNNTTVAEVVSILTGNTTTSVSLTIAFQTISPANQSDLNVLEDHSNIITFLRGNAKSDDAEVNIFDALFIAQYIVGQRPLNDINSLNAASIHHDGTSGDIIDIFDALFIAQYTVGQKNAYFY